MYMITLSYCTDFVHSPIVGKLPGLCEQAGESRTHFLEKTGYTPVLIYIDLFGRRDLG